MGKAGGRRLLVSKAGGHKVKVKAEGQVVSC